MADVMESLKTSVDNAGIITAQLAQLTYKMNNGNGALSRLISDEGFSNSIQHLFNLRQEGDYELEDIDDVIIRNAKTEAEEILRMTVEFLSLQ